MDSGHRGTTVERVRSTVDALPADARARVELIDAMTADRRAPSKESFQTDDDGDLITIDVLIDEDDDELHEEILKVVEDVRCLNRAGRPFLQVRFFRDGRRDDGDLIVSPTDPWPVGDEPIAVDFHGAQDCALEQMETLLELADVVGQTGRTVYFLNLPAPLRLHAEVCGAPFLVPIKREKAGPRLPEVLVQLR
jgi:hypothetical protein